MLPMCYRLSTRSYESTNHQLIELTPNSIFNSSMNKYRFYLASKCIPLLVTMLIGLGDNS